MLVHGSILQRSRSGNALVGAELLLQMPHRQHQRQPRIRHRPSLIARLTGTSQLHRGQAQQAHGNHRDQKQQTHTHHKRERFVFPHWAIEFHDNG
jgi:hypothetical protein